MKPNEKYDIRFMLKDLKEEKSILEKRLKEVDRWIKTIEMVVNIANKNKLLEKENL